MNKIDWIKDLVHGEEQMESVGLVDISIGFDNEKYLIQETLSFLQNLKDSFVDASNIFNELKSSTLGRVKIYGIAKTQADFMLFRNGYKMIFSLRDPGIISIRFNFVGTHHLGSSGSEPGALLGEENFLIARRGPLADIIWTFQEQEVSLNSIIRYHMTVFIKESAK